MADSPYKGLPEERWLERTKELVEAHPLAAEEIVEVVLQCWYGIFESSIGKGFHIGEHIFPKPQIMGFLLHELIPLEFEVRYPGKWRGDKAATDKDLVYVEDSYYSVEIKTSSARGKVFANRSYAQEETAGKKSKSGYYLTANFGKFVGKERPEIMLIRFGWLDHQDWIGQAAATGQQAHLRPAADRFKLLVLYSRK